MPLRRISSGTGAWPQASSTAPLFPAARQELTRLDPYRGRVLLNSRGGPLERRSVARTLKKRYLAAGLSEKYNVHTLRHTFASWLRIDGVPLSHIQAYLGHGSISTTEGYAHVPPSEIGRLGGDTFRSL